MSIEALIEARGKLEEVRDSLSQRTGAPLTGDLTEALDAVDLALEVTRGFGIGECQEDVPFAGLFFLINDGHAFLKCTHDEPHIVEL